MFNTKYQAVQEGSFGDTFSKHIAKLEQMVDECRDIKNESKRLKYIERYVVPEFRKSIYASETSIANIAMIVSLLLAILGFGTLPIGIVGGFGVYIRTERRKESMRILNDQIQFLDNEIYRLKSTKSKRDAIERLEYTKDRLEAAKVELDIPWTIT